MSVVIDTLRRGLELRVERAAAAVDQATAGPVVLRATLVVAAVAGFAVTWPPAVFPTPAVVLPIMFAVGVGMAPRSFFPTATIIAMVLGYLFNVANGGSPDAWRPITAAGLIYVVHTGAAFASVLPFNTVATPGLYLPFVLRTAAVIAITVVIGLTILAVPRLVGDHRLVSAAVIGMVAMVGVAGYVAYLGSRRR